MGDSVIAGLNRDDISVLLVPRLDECRKFAGLASSLPGIEVLEHPRVRSFFQGLIDTLWREGTGSANRVARAHVLLEQPSLETGEMTDKGSLNQRAVLTRRAVVGRCDVRRDRSALARSEQGLKAITGKQA